MRERNRTSLELKTPPSGFPITLDQVKAHLRIDDSADDALLNSFISAATSLVERYLDQRLLTQTWIYWLDGFPSRTLFDNLRPDGVTEGALSEYLSVQRDVKIPIYPLQSVVEIKTYGEYDTPFTFSSSDYEVEPTKSRPGRVSLRRQATWPSTILRSMRGVSIEFICGYGTASDVPPAITQALLETVAKFYNGRGCSDGANMVGLSPTAIALLSQYRIPTVC